jgi:hypothetical protein
MEFDTPIINHKHKVHDFLFCVCTQLEVRSDHEKTPDVKGAVMADSSLTQTAIYRKLKHLTQLIHTSQGKPADPNPAAVTPVMTPVVSVSHTAKVRGGKRKPAPRAVCRHFVLLELLG